MVKIKFFNLSGLLGYPVNVRFAQRLTDLGLTPEQYFSVENDTEDAKQLAQAVYVRFYASEIGIEELDIFDLKIKSIFNRNKEQFVKLLTLRRTILNANGVITETTREKEHTYNYDNVIEDSANTEVYTDVSESTASRTHSGADSDNGTETETVKAVGDAEYFKNIQGLTVDVQERFTELFINLFMEVF